MTNKELIEQATILARLAEKEAQCRALAKRYRLGSFARNQFDAAANKIAKQIADLCDAIRNGVAGKGN